MTDTCPHCHANLQGKPIPEDRREHYGNNTHFSRRIALVDQTRDRLTAWKCPDCLKEWYP